MISEGATAQYKNKKMINVRKESCRKSGKILGISTFDFLDFPDMKLDSIPHLEINMAIEKVIKKYNPKIVYTTSSNDLNKDHQKVFESTLVVTRPTSSSVKQVFCYEIPGYTMKSFQPNVYENVSRELSFKIQAFKCYKSEIEEFPHPRSINVIENLAMQRGMEAGVMRVEAFELIRSISD